ncbi:hypothetical protein H4W31_001203 [Plantactinospora soyae]|uniref:Integrase SAM-like N-terminal domain-containing protein n=1 Tax=Plantactinospora soyae TaxID=1544732 RepID=A0A927QVC4_9ACTN|nr:hypothetical protein [Plantactinospora soyae]
MTCLITRLARLGVRLRFPFAAAPGRAAVYAQSSVCAQPSRGRESGPFVPCQGRDKASASTAGTVNPITRKEYQSDQYKPRTVRHSNAVLRAFYEYWTKEGQGPLRNPVPRDRRGSRPNAHHNPLEPFRPEGRLRYNPKVPKTVDLGLPVIRGR